MISLVVVGGAIAVVLWLTVGDLPKPATGEPESGRADPEPPEPENDLETTDQVIDGLESVPLEEEADVVSVQPRRAPTAVRQPVTVVVDGPVVAPTAVEYRVSWFQRARSGMSLLGIVAVVGLGLAAVVATIAVMISSALESAVQ